VTDDAAWDAHQFRGLDPLVLGLDLIRFIMIQFITILLISRDFGIQTRYSNPKLETRNMPNTHYMRDSAHLHPSPMHNLFSRSPRLPLMILRHLTPGNATSLTHALENTTLIVQHKRIIQLRYPSLIHHHDAVI